MFLSYPKLLQYTSKCLYSDYCKSVPVWLIHKQREVAAFSSGNVLLQFCLLNARAPKVAWCTFNFSSVCHTKLLVYYYDLLCLVNSSFVFNEWNNNIQVWRERLFIRIGSFSYSVAFAPLQAVRSINRDRPPMVHFSTPCPLKFDLVLGRGCCPSF